MRTALLLPLALAAAAAGGCRTASDGTEQTAFRVPQRDLTLREAQAPEVEVASPVELGRAPVEPRATHRRQRVRPLTPAPRLEVPEPRGAPAAPAEPAPLASSASEPADPHALAPGQTVTIIPASGGTTTEGDWTDQRPSSAGGGVMVGPGGHGGGCRPRGPGMRPRGTGVGAFRGPP